MKFSDIKKIVAELVNEEISEINHTLDSSGKSVIAVGAPGSVARFAAEHTDVITQMREWVKDCQWRDLEEDGVDELSNEELLRGVQNAFDGGIRGFIQTCDSKAETPVGYKESIRENWSGGQFDDEPDGYSNDSQRAFAHSQATTPRGNDTKKAIELAKKGKFVLVVENPVFCKSTDACLGNNISIHGVYDTRELAEKEQEKFHVAEHSDTNTRIIGPDNLEPKQHKDPVGGDDDVPFQEGVGYVSAKDRAKDPKSIPGEHWRVKFQSAGDLKKRGNTEMSPVNEISKQQLKEVVKKIVSEMWDSRNDVNGDEVHDVNEITPLSDPFKVQSDLNAFSKYKPRHFISKPVKTLNNEWMVKWMTNGKRDENKTYYTDDSQDAVATYNHMLKNAEEMNKSGK